MRRHRGPCRRTNFYVHEDGTVCLRCSRCGQYVSIFESNGRYYVLKVLPIERPQENGEVSCRLGRLRHATSG